LITIIDVHKYASFTLFFSNLGNPEDDLISSDTAVEEMVMNVEHNIGGNQHCTSFVTFDCTEPHCVMQFRREDRLRAHLLLDSHKNIIPSFRLFDKTVLMYRESIDSDNPNEIPILSSTNTTATNSTLLRVQLDEGWALFYPREKIAFTPTQRSYLNQKYDEEEKSGAKWDPGTVAEVSLIYLTRYFSTRNSFLVDLAHANGLKKGQYLFEPDQFLSTSQIK
jgi:hypothetical protein